VKDLRQVWTPSSNTRDWANELAADAIALWTCGPAFLIAMQHALETRKIRPYEMSQTHPPYELRLRLLLDLADNLEWADECSDLKQILRTWQTDSRPADANSYAALAHFTLAEECASEIVKACRGWGLPLCTPETTREIKAKAKTTHTFTSATELILAAWSVYREDPDAMEGWESRALAQLQAELNGNT
jgi:hypothetical protein